MHSATNICIFPLDLPSTRKEKISFSAEILQIVGERRFELAASMALDFVNKVIEKHENPIADYLKMVKPVGSGIGMHAAALYCRYVYETHAGLKPNFLQGTSNHYLKIMFKS